ncbi:hypothetical protein TNCV_2678811 [Trichonephila clavipes]|nr:hypothetical protein TNCV_2678811 [Trichonephila clavipes]
MCNAQQLFRVRPKVTRTEDRDIWGISTWNIKLVCFKVKGCIRAVLLSWGLLVESENWSCESDPVDDETDEDKNNNNESSKGPSNVEAFFALDSFGVVRTTIRVLSYSTTTA